MNKDMDCCTDGPALAESRGGQTALSRIRSWIVTPRGLTISGIAAVAVGLAVNWSWLVAVGAAPLILSLAPCAAMCALGLCMNMRGNSRGTTRPLNEPRMPAQHQPPSTGQVQLPQGLEDHHELIRS